MKKDSKIVSNGIKINFSSLLSQQDTRKAVETIIQQSTIDVKSAQKSSQKNVQKQKVTQFLTSVLSYLQDQSATPKSKFYTMLIFRDLTQRSTTKILSFLSGHPLLGYLTNLARIVDPNEVIQKKGRKFFEKDPESGNEFIRIILQCIKYWGEKFVKIKTTLQPTKFRKAYNSLLENRIVLPHQYKYFKTAMVKFQQQSPIKKVNHQQNQHPKGLPNKFLNDLRFTIDKINNYITELQDSNSIQETQQIIRANRNKFLQDFQKYQKNQGKILDENHAQTVQKYIQINQYINVQGKAYNSFIPIKDYLSYMTEVKIAVENIFKEEKSIVMQQKNKVQEQVQKPPKKKPTSIVNFQVQPQIKKKQAYQDISKTARINNQPLIKSFLGQIQNKSKSPGFKSVKQQIHQEKKIIMTHPPRQAGKSPISKTNKSMSYSNLTVNKISQIFLSPPNTNLPSKNYEGKIILQDAKVKQILYDIHQQQGLKKFKHSHFKQKNSLFDNGHIQIGYKSEVIYDNIHNFNQFIRFEIFIGNKTQSQIRNLKVQYRGSQNLLLYAHPRQLQSIIPSGFQNKQQLIIISLRIPFPYLKMRIQYEHNGQQYNTAIVVPNSIMKLAQYNKITKNQYYNNWKNGVVYKSETFALSEYISPEMFEKLIPQVDSLGRYSDFEVQGSITDYQLICGISLLKKYHGTLKVNFRPNLQVIIQISVLSKDEQSQNYFQFYVQTLQLMLQQFHI